MGNRQTENLSKSSDDSTSPSTLKVCLQDIPRQSNAITPLYIFISKPLPIIKGPQPPLSHYISINNIMNNQQVNKIITFLRMNEDYHSPYIFLLDGNFLKLLVEKQVHLEQKLRHLLPGKFILKVTECILSELEMLGPNFRIVSNSAKQLQCLRCQHSLQSADKCIRMHASTNKLIVCSQDIVLRRKLRPLKAGAMYFGPDQRITMEDIEKHQMRDVRKEEKQKFGVSAIEENAIQQFQQQQKVKQKLKAKRQLNKIAASKGVQLKYLKKKITKRPNPLSVKKKKKVKQNAD